MGARGGGRGHGGSEPAVTELEGIFGGFAQVVGRGEVFFRRVFHGLAVEIDQDVVNVGVAPGVDLVEEAIEIAVVKISFPGAHGDVGEREVAAREAAHFFAGREIFLVEMVGVAVGGGMRGLELRERHAHFVFFDVLGEAGCGEEKSDGHGKPFHFLRLTSGRRLRYAKDQAPGEKIVRQSGVKSGATIKRRRAPPTLETSFGAAGRPAITTGRQAPKKAYS